MVVVLDDELFVLQLVRSLLERMGHEVQTAQTCAEAVQLLKQEPWDIALLDIVLGPEGGEGGMEVLRVARSVSPDSPVLMVTGVPTLETAQQALRLGAFDYIKKPIDAQILLDAVHRGLKQRELLLERRRLERENLQARQRLEAIFDSVADGIVTIDRQCAILALNAAAASLLDVPISKALGMPLRDVCGHEGPAIAHAVEKSLETREFVREYQVTHTIRDRELSYVISVTPLSGATQEGAVLVIRDVSRLRDLEREMSERFSFENMIGKSPPMLKVFDMIRNLADTDTTVLIQGPSGTGKELVGDALHYHGARRDGPLVKVNCSALPENLLESELFGHVRGAFTGATRDKIGRFELAHSGTIFLDEIGDISPQLQQRLLRVLQQREIERVGSTKTIRIDVRVVAATNRDLAQLVQRGLFREDLYYRLNVVTIHLPLLRDRREDIPLLVRHFLQRLQVRLDRTITGVDPAVMEILLGYDWPGNVRQLENVLEHAVILSRDSVIRPENLPPELTRPRMPQRYVQPSGPRSVDARTLREVLESVGWNRSRAARRLGINRTTVWRKIKEYGLNPPAD